MVMGDYRKALETRLLKRLDDRVGPLAAGLQGSHEHIMVLHGKLQSADMRGWETVDKQLRDALEGQIAAFRSELQQVEEGQLQACHALRDEVRQDVAKAAEAGKRRSREATPAACRRACSRRESGSSSSSVPTWISVGGRPRRSAATGDISGCRGSAPAA